MNGYVPVTRDVGHGVYEWEYPGDRSRRGESDPTTTTEATTMLGHGTKTFLADQAAGGEAGEYGGDIECEERERLAKGRRDERNGGVRGGGEGGARDADEGDDEVDGEMDMLRRKFCFCLSRWDYTAREYWSEIKIIVKLALPNIAYMLLEALMTIMAVLFSGHLGKNELAAASFANSITTVFTRSIGLGFASSCDTLFSQFYGSSRRDRIGVILQRGLLIMFLLCFICWGILINTETILLLAQQNSSVAWLAGIYCIIYIPAVPADYCSMLLIKYLQCQSRMKPVVITTALTNVISVPIYYVLVYSLDLRLHGAAVAQVIAHYILSALLIVYITWRKLYQETWKGWSRDSLRNWSPIVKLGIAGCLMVCLEWWSFDVGYFLAGLYGEEQIGAHAIIMYTATTGDMISYGLGTAASIRVGNSLGGRRPKTAHLASVAGLFLAVFTATFLAILYAGLKDVIPHFFTSDSDTRAIASSILPICAMFSLLDTTSSVCSGVIRGTGRQEVGALVNLLGYYLIGLPLAVCLMFPLRRGVHGFWSGMTVGLLVQAIFLITFTFRLDWPKETRKAQKRIGLHKSEGTVGLDALSDIHSTRGEDEIDGDDDISSDNEGDVSSATLPSTDPLGEPSGGGVSACPTADKSTQTPISYMDSGLRTLRGHDYVAVSYDEDYVIPIASGSCSPGGAASKEAEAMRDAVRYGTKTRCRVGMSRLLFAYAALLFMAAAIACYVLAVPSLRAAAIEREMFGANMTTTDTNMALTTN